MTEHNAIQSADLPFDQNDGAAEVQNPLQENVVVTQQSTNPVDAITTDVIQQIKQLILLLERESASVVNGNYSAIRVFGIEKEELMNSYLQNRKDLAAKYGSECSWIDTLNTETRDQLRQLAHDFDKAIDRNQTALERARSAVNVMLAAYCEAIRGTCFEDSIYNSSGSLENNPLPSVAYRETI